MKKYRSFIFATMLMLIAVFFVCAIDDQTVNAETGTHTVTFDFNLERI